MTIFEAMLQPNSTKRNPICLMGVNGSGKTRFLTDLHERMRSAECRSIFIPAQREFSGSISSTSFGAIQTPVTIENILNFAASPQQYHQTNFSNLASQLINVIRLEDWKNDDIFVEAIKKWLENDENGPKPQPPLRRLPKLLSDLSEVFGHPLHLNNNARFLGRQEVVELCATIENTEVRANALSSGERQILLFSILMLQNPDQHMVIMVDEPELHLNEARAIDLWEGLERKLENATFLYATHSLNFATRSAVKHLFVVEKGLLPVELNPSGEIPNAVIRDLVGARVRIMRDETTPIFCEDQGHILLLDNLLNVKSIQPIAIEARERVIDAVSSRRAYDEIFPSHPIRCGLIDRDQASEEEINGLEKIGIFSLPFNEFECCILHPDIAANYIESDGGAALGAERHKLALTKAASAAFPETLTKLKSQIEKDFPQSIRYRSTDGHISAEVSADHKIVDEFLRRATAVKNACDNGDVISILKLLKGKKLYQHFRVILRSDFGFDIPASAYLLYRQIRHHPNFTLTLQNIPEMSELRDRIERHLSTN